MEQAEKIQKKIEAKTEMLTDKVDEAQGLAGIENDEELGPTLQAKKWEIDLDGIPTGGVVESNNWKLFIVIACKFIVLGA